MNGNDGRTVPTPAAYLKRKRLFMDCDTLIRSNNTYDILISRESTEIFPVPVECTQEIGDNYLVDYFDRSTVGPLNISEYGYSVIPKCYGLLDTLALEESRIIQLQNQTAVALKGQGVLIGIIDTGISYELPCFRNSDGSTRIHAAWDQSIPATEPSQLPEGFLYGTEYSSDDINAALRSENPKELVPLSDENGHGTMLSSIIAGSEDPTAGFTGAAPYAELIVVKLKPAKQYLKEFYYIPAGTDVYQENDIMAAVSYLDQTARKSGKPLVICLGLGTNNGSHSGSGNLSNFLNDIGSRWRRCIVTATGNEANARHHFYGKSDGKNTIEMEINADQKMNGFYLELWASATEMFTVSVRSPGGTTLYGPNYSENSHTEREFIFEGTQVEIDYWQDARTRGNQLIFIRFTEPSAGIWTVFVTPGTTITGTFHAWLPMSGMLERDIIFLRPDPDVTLTGPSAAEIPIGVGGYNPGSGALYLNSGRGYSLSSVVKPDFTAPAVSVSAIGRLGNPVTMTGTSAAAAITAGACAQIMEWGDVRGKRPLLNSVVIGNILVRGSVRSQDISYPNTSWGYGKMNVYDAMMRLF